MSTGAMREESTDPAITFDPAWQEAYVQGHIQRYPWDTVVSFVYRYAPNGADRSKVQILEVGCGTGSNLWFAAREGFSVAGVDASKKAIDVAMERFGREGLSADLIIADFTCLPIVNKRFDLAIDRSGITTCGLSGGMRAIEEVRRILKPEGFFFFNPLASGHYSETTGRAGPDGVILDISGGTLTGYGQVCFYSEATIRSIFSEGWRLASLRHISNVEKADGRDELHSEWRVIAQKI